MNRDNIVGALDRIRRVMNDRRDELIKLDQRFGDGDLGISMNQGFEAAYQAAHNSDERDLGKLLFICGRAMNEAAPSSLGTMLSTWMIGMAKELKGSEAMDLAQLASAMYQGVNELSKVVDGRVGEKTVLDALVPAVDSLKNSIADDAKTAIHKAALAAREGSDSTKNMPSVYGRAGYYGDKTIGFVDGGSVAAAYFFEAIDSYVQSLDT